MTVTQEIIGQRLAQARHHAGLTPHQVAASLHLSLDDVSAMETGARSIDIPTLQNWADLYGLALMDFLSEDPIPETLDSLASLSIWSDLSLSFQDLATIREVQQFTRNLDALNRLLEEDDA